MMDSWENDWADPFSDEPITSPPPRRARTRTKVQVQSGDEAKISKYPNPTPSEGADKVSPAPEAKIDDAPRDLQNREEDENLESSHNKKKWKKSKSLESQKNRDAGTSKGSEITQERKTPQDSKTPLDIKSPQDQKGSKPDESPKKKKKDEIKSFDQAVNLLMNPRTKSSTGDASAFVANLFDTWLQKSPIRRLFRPSKIEDTKVEILGNLIKELKRETLDEIAVVYYEKIDDVAKHVKDETYQAMWNKRIEHFTNSLIAAASFDYFNKIEGPGYKIIWKVAEKHQIDEVQDAVFKSLLVNVCNFPDVADFRTRGSVPSKISDFRSTDKFLQLNFMQLKELFTFLKGHLVFWDKLLLGFINWLSRDESLLQFQKTIYNTIKECRFSQNCVQSLSSNEEISNSPKIAGMLRSIKREIDAKKRITIFSDFLITDDVTKGQTVTFEDGERCCCMQQFDLESMSWMSFQEVTVHKLSNFAMCQYMDFVLMIGGESASEAVCLKYNVQENTVEFMGCTKFETYQFCSLGVFQDGWYVTQGKADRTTREAVYQKVPNGEWNELQLLKHAATSTAIMLSTTDVMYVVHGLRETRSSLWIAFNSFSSQRQAWETLAILPEGRDIYGENFFILDNMLCCIYKMRHDLVEAWYDHGKRVWEKRVYEGTMDDIAYGLGYKVSVDIIRVCQFPDKESVELSVYLCVGKDTEINAMNLIPNVIWYWGIDNSIEDIILSLPRGKRQVGWTESTKILYTIGL